MKKRLVAFLLVLIMVLGMLPVSAFAADDGVSPQALDTGHKIDVTFTVLYVGDEFRIGYNYGTSEKTQFVCQYSTPHSDTAYNNHTIAISDIKAAADRASVNSGYQIVGWSKEANENPTVWPLNKAGTTACNKGTSIYLVAKNPNPEVTYTLTYYPNTTDLVTNMPSPNPVTQKSSTSPVTFTVSSAIPAREGYNFLGWNGKPDATTPTVQPGNWVTTPATTTRLYAVWQSNTPPTDMPAKPTENDVTGVVVDIVCVTTTGTHDTVQYPLGFATTPQHTIGEVASDGAGGYICPVTVRTAWFVQQASNLVWKVQHTPTAQTITFNLTYDKNSKTWVKPAANPRIEATHEVTPPTKPTALDGSFAIVCKNNKATHPYKANYIATPSQYTISDVQKDEQGYYVTATVTVAPNLVAYNTATRAEHRLVNEQDATLTITFRYNPKATGDGNRKWQQQGDLPVVEVICKPKAPTADELKKLDMAVQVKCVVDAAQQHTDAYGLLGEYDEDYFVGEPRKDGDDWLCDISYLPDRYVAAFNKAFPTPKHIQNDEKIVPVTLIWVGGSWQIKTQGRVLVTEVYTVTFDSYGGTPVPPKQEVEYGHTATKPADPTLKGYTFAFWYLGEDEQNATAYDFNTPVTENITLTAKWTQNTYTVTFETNGGSAINPVTVRHGNAVARPADPTKDKYTFIGWYADPEFTEEYDFATVLEADKTIYAKFELTSTPIGDIYVRYDVLHIKQLPDGTYDLANAEVEHLSAKKDTTVTAVIKDYRATHHVNVNRTLSKLTGTAIQPYMGVDGKPVYTILSVYYDLDFHTLTFDTMGGSKIAPETVRHGLTVAKPKDPVNGGYIFDGWYTDKTFRYRYDFSTPLTEDITIYAKWFLIVLPGVTVKKNTPKLNTADHFAYVQGYPDGTVKPAGNITRAETAAILFRLMDDASRKTYYSTKSGFRDVASGSWYNTYVATLNNAGVITDSSNGYFRPNEAITRAELAAMLAKFSETTGAANYFNDVSAKYWAANAIAICAKLGWINGYPDGTFRPDKNVTRAELMAMINRATGRAPKSADAFLPGMKTWSDNTADKWYYLDVQEATNSHSYTVKGSETWTALTSDPNWSLYE